MSKAHPTVQLFAGKRIGKLTLLRLVKETDNRKRCGWECQCDCGNVKWVYNASLRMEATKSCGCAWIRGKKPIHGMSRTKVYRIWKSMRDRCNNPRCQDYPGYGGRGIQVCERWNHSFPNFLADMGPRPTPAHSIDRIDGKGNYCPENCRWATAKVQARDHTINLTYNGKTLNLLDWSKELGMSYTTIWGRYRHGLSVDRILSRSRLRPGPARTLRVMFPTGPRTPKPPRPESALRGPLEHP